MRRGPLIESRNLGCRGHGCFLGTHVGGQVQQLPVQRCAFPCSLAFVQTDFPGIGLECGIRGFERIGEGGVGMAVADIGLAERCPPSPVLAVGNQAVQECGIDFGRGGCYRRARNRSQPWQETAAAPVGQAKTEDGQAGGGSFDQCSRRTERGRIHVDVGGVIAGEQFAFEQRAPQVDASRILFRELVPCRRCGGTHGQQMGAGMTGECRSHQAGEADAVYRPEFVG